MPTRVIRQQVSFTPRQLAALERLAARLQRTKAELVREAIDRLLADPPGRRIPRAGLVRDVVLRQGADRARNGDT